MGNVSGAQRAKSKPYLKLYKTSRWRRKRESQLSREPFCHMCRQRGLKTQATVADHIERHNGDERKFWSIPLQSTCKPCHDGAKQELERSGTLRGCKADGTPLDTKHHWSGND